MSFWEIFVIGVIALVVLGPERLPKAARTVGLWIGKAKNGFNSIKTEIDRELKVKELQEQIEQQKQQIAEQSGLEDIKSSQESMNQIMNDVQNPLESLSEQESLNVKTSQEKNDGQSSAN